MKGWEYLEIFMDLWMHCGPIEQNAKEKNTRRMLVTKLFVTDLDQAS